MSASKLVGIAPAFSSHVLTLTPFYPTVNNEASGCFVSEPLVWLTKLGVRHTVIALQPIYRGDLKSAASEIPAQWFRYFSFPRGWGLSTAGAFAFARIVGPLRELHRKSPIALIHAHGPLPCGHSAMLLSRELGIPFVVSVHGLDAYSTEQVSGRAGEWCRRISQRVYLASRRVICVSEHVRENVLGGVGRNCRTSVVYNGVDPELFAAGGESVKDPVVLSVGNLIPTKGHDVLIRGVARIAKESPSLNLQIIGEGPERGRLQALAQELGVSERVRFLGLQSRRFVAKAMGECTVFALASRYEGLGCVYLEAMAAAKPIIGCRGQGIAEIVQHGTNGFLVGPDNERELSVALTILLGDENRRHNVGRAARETILDQHTLADQAERLVRIYRESVV